MSDWSAETDLLPVGLAVKEARMHMLRLDIEACQKLVAFPAKAVLQEYSLHSCNQLSQAPLQLQNAEDFRRGMCNPVRL